MTWSYDTALSTDKDKVRLLIGDTDTNNQLLSDEEISYFLTDSTVNRAALTACESLSAKFAKYTDESMSGDSKSYSQLHDHYASLAEIIKKKMLLNITPYFGGVYVSDIDSIESNSDLKEFPFD